MSELAAIVKNAILIGCRRYSLRQGSEGEYVALFSATNPNNGQSGFLLWETKWNGRDVTMERLSIDNPNLLIDSVDESPAAYLSVSDPDTGTNPDDHPRFEECTHVVYGEH